jgi:hypothetical protein
MTQTDLIPMTQQDGTERSVSFAGAVNTPANRFAQLGTSVADGHAPALGAVVVLTAWLIAFGSYAVLAYRRTGRTV